METRRTWVITLDHMLAKLAGESMRELIVESRTIRGGVEASVVALVTVRYQTQFGRSKMLRCVAKQLTGRPAREAAVYEHLVPAHAQHLAPRLLAVEHTGDGGAILLIEAIRRAKAWPWRKMEVIEDLIARLAEFHASAEHAAALIPEWDYEAELQETAEHTRLALERCRGDPDLLLLGRDLPALNKVVRALPEIRHELLAERLFGCRPIHGDVHPGNVLVRRRGGRDRPVLLDWGRARLASPLEDVSSWLQSLGYWEPEGRRRHDTLLAAYLSALGMNRTLTSSLRAAYWMAGASNVLSGALLYHLDIAADPHRPQVQRTAAVKAARDALRVVRRTNACWS
jgi:aminoglycoside phosphotransferase (APT) family kinase protein